MRASHSHGGSFPVLVAYVAQTDRLAVSPVIAAAAAFALSAAQRQLSTRARLIRRRSTAVGGQITLASGEVMPIDEPMLLAPLERALLAMSWAVVLLPRPWRFAPGLAAVRRAPAETSIDGSPPVLGPRSPLRESFRLAFGWRDDNPGSANPFGLPSRPSSPSTRDGGRGVEPAGVTQPSVQIPRHSSRQTR